MRENQIEEMCKIMRCVDNQSCANTPMCPESHDICDRVSCRQCKEARLLLDAGYRKQSEDVTDINVGNKSEWISVEDRLPESTQMVLCYTPCDGYIFVGYYQEVKHSYWKSYWNIITAMRSTKKVTKKVTHWKPLPEPPKMKGE